MTSSWGWNHKQTTMTKYEPCLYLFNFFYILYIFPIIRIPLAAELSKSGCTHAAVVSHMKYLHSLILPCPSTKRPIIWRRYLKRIIFKANGCTGSEPDEIMMTSSPVPVNSSRKGQWRGALMFSLICVWINGWVNNREAGDLRRYRSHYDFNVMYQPWIK